MKIQCVLCKEIVPIGTFHASAAGINVTCSACAGEFFVESGNAQAEASDDAAGDSPAQDAAVVCPKCGLGQDETEACRGCGLRVALFDDYHVDEDEEAVAELSPQWERVVAAWDDATAHKEFLDAVSIATQFAWAARKYRARLRAHPGDETCKNQLNRIARMAEATLAVSNPSDLGDAKAPFRNVALLLVVLLLFAGLGGLYFLFKLKSAPEKPPTGPEIQLTNPPVRAPTASP